MATFQAPTVFYSLDDDKKNFYYNSINASPPSAASSSLTGSQEDLLPDLWMEPSKQQQLPPKQQSFFIPQQSFPQAQATASVSPFSYVQSSSQTPSSTRNDQFSNVRSLASSDTVMMRGSSLEYAQSLLPHSLLAPLTEENLDFYQKKQSASPNHENFYTFDNQRPTQLHKPGVKYSSSLGENLANASTEHHSHDSTCQPRNPKLRNGSVSSCHSNGTPKQKNINTQLYKTELCVSFMKMGVCPYGSKCQFAHGEDELKQVERPANWRSRPCANWSKFGSCRYGKRCCFKHGD